VAAKPNRQGRRRDADVPRHRPKVVRPHLADEYEALGDKETAAQLRRQLRGHENVPVSMARREVSS
jgi:hypothetical protein